MLHVDEGDQRRGKPEVVHRLLRFPLDPWYCIALFDLRFSTDSIFERISKALHIGVIIGFAVAGPTWHTDGGYIMKSYSMISYILMTSRLILAVQYGVATFLTWKKKLQEQATLTVLLTTVI